MDGGRPEPCPLGVNGGEFPHWSVGRICDLAMKCGIPQSHGLGPLSPSPPRGRREHDTNRREARG
jgi:hypothetical protein